MIYKISKDFSDAPGGRYIKDGPLSGEEFRNNILIPMYEKCLLNNEELTIDFDGGWGYILCFLEESFGGMVRLGHNADEMLKTIKFISEEEPELINKVKRFILESKEDVLKHKLYKE